MSLDLRISSLTRAYAGGQLRPSEVISEIFKRIDARGQDAVWIHLLDVATVQAHVRHAEERRSRGEFLPLFGIPFAIKDNIDLAGCPTTAACPDFAYVPEHSAAVVQKLLDAGAIPIGKANLDQFATGLVGVRSPYGAPRSVFSLAHISGGSSSGSAVAVAAGLVSFALGTDTAGSGRVPAAFNNIVGLKPTCGRLSTTGLVPACRTLDCISVFTTDCAGAQAVLRVVEGADASDAFSRTVPVNSSEKSFSAAFRFGVPPPEQLEFFGDTAAAALFAAACRDLERMGGTSVEVDFRPFRETALLLYSGPWVAERMAAIRDFYASHASSIHPTVRTIISGAEKLTAVDAFTGLYRLQELRRKVEPIWRDMDFLLLPTTGTTYTVAEVEADPVALNSNLGYYTNFVNLLDLSALAVPAGFRPSGLPFGVTFIAPAFSDDALCELGRRWESRQPSATSTVQVAVVGAHLSGQPLNGQLTGRGAKLVRTSQTSPDYRLLALPGTTPLKPGLERIATGTGHAIEVEVWEMPLAELGGFVALIPPPLGIGTLRLEDGSDVKGFICEPYALGGAEDISRFGGWKNYLKSLNSPHLPS